MADDFPGDEVEDRLAANARRFGIDPAAPTGSFSNQVDEAVIHAADSARLDGQSAAHPWYSIGPRNVGGRVETIAQDPLTPRRFYAGTVFGGLWRTEDAGDTWRPLSVFLEADLNPGLADKDVAVPIGAIGLCHRSPQTVYVGTGDVRGSAFTGTGLWQSTDGGQTFTRIAQVGAGPLQALGYERIEVDPWNAGRCWIACHLGLFRREPTTPAPHLMQDIVDAANAPAAQNVTDVVIDFGDRTAAAPPGVFTVYVGMHGSTAASPGGIFRAVFDPATNAYRRTNPANPLSPVWTRLADADLPFPVAQPGAGLTGRVRLALCEKAPRNVYAVVGLADGTPSAVFRSTDGGDSWAPTAARTQERSTIAWYALMLACHPEDPQIVFTGSTDIFRTVNGGASWDRVLDFDRFEGGERAQHADQHAFIFDRRDPRRVWSGNDGGISESRNLGLSWRKRSHGIVAAQFYDLAVHPTFPYIMGGGLQDNGCWFTVGGPSWFHCARADGGGVAFQPGATDVFLTSHQGGTTRAEATLRFLPTLRPATGTFGRQGSRDLLASWLADRPTGTGPNGETTFPYLVMDVQDFTPGVAGANQGTIFGRKMEGHPVRPDTFIAGFTGAAYNVASGALGAVPPATSNLAFGALTTGAFAPAANVSAISFAPTLPARAPSPNSDTVWWIGTDQGQLFFTPDGGTTWHDATPRLTAAGHAGAEITGIAIHPGNTAIAVVTTAAPQNNVFLSANALSVAAGVPNSTWRAISHSAPAPAPGNPRLDLPVGAIGRAVIDPASPTVSDAANHQTVYVGTIAGVYVCRNASADATVAPLWNTFNAGMPLVLVSDIDYVESYAADGTTVARRLLRAATFGRGIWECDLASAAPAARLVVRSTPIDDGHRYFTTQAISHDPRLNTPGAAVVPLDRARAIDIRIDPPPYQYFGEVLDPVEFDEDFRSGTLVTGDANFVYVQIQNRGPQPVAGAVLHLYFADAPAGAAPDLDADFWDRFPNDPTPGGTWRRAGQVPVPDIRPEQPRIGRIEWVPPASLGNAVALLAVVSAPEDDLGPVKATLPRVVQPDAAGTTLTAIERRCALHITPARRTVPDVFVRDGVGDSGEPGAIAWGGRTADIIVTDEVLPDPDAALPSIADPRTEDRIRGGQDNHIYVRVFNRSPTALTATVSLFFVPMQDAANQAAWQPIGAPQDVTDIPARGHKISPVFTWAAADIPDPAPDTAIKAHVLIALIGTAEDAAPNPAGISILSAFWDFFLDAAPQNNASFRAIRFVPAGGIV